VANPNTRKTILQVHQNAQIAKGTTFQRIGIAWFIVKSTKRLIAFENLAMSDARKLVYKNLIKIINSGIENFLILKEKFFTPNEVVSKGTHSCQH